MLSLKNLTKKSDSINAQTIQQAISNRFLDHKYIIFNSYLFEWESDYFSVNESGYVYEVEIKLTKGDFKKDFNKEGKHLLLESKTEALKIPNKFFYATPRGLLPSYKIPEYAGLIEISNTDTGMEAEVIVNAPFLHRENVFELLKPNLLDKFYHKYRRTEYDNYELNKEIDRLKKELEEKNKSV